MMTGKAMRPLLSLGLGKESDTWATSLRRYGYKTAAFYPPAVFYIDAERFTDSREGLGFEYRWVEFTSAEEKVGEVERYLARPVRSRSSCGCICSSRTSRMSSPVAPFGGGAPLPVDAYDSEVATRTQPSVSSPSRAGAPAEGRGDRHRRPRRGVREHGGRYHGTTCYEEQVRVPLVISGPGVARGRVPTVVQTIDLLPTVLSALGIPRPARVRGRDLGAMLAAGGRPGR